jgi:hypothetical protein
VKPQRKSTRQRPLAAGRAASLIWNILTVLMLLASVGLAGLFAAIYVDPASGLNPFPSPTPLPLLVQAPVLPTQLPSLTPTATALPSETPTPTATAAPTETPTPSPSATVLAGQAPAPTLRPTATAGGFAFVAQEGSPAAISYSIYSEVGCSFLGVGGRVLGLDGSPVTPGVIVRLRGTLDGRQVSMDTLSGTATQYGESGFGFQLSDRPITSNYSLFVQLLDQAYLPMSERVFFETYDTCDKNLIFITFRQVR